MNMAEERFWAHVKKAPGKACWEWTGALTDQGYGRFFDGRRVTSPHRFSWALHSNGGVIPRGAFVCHHCDNPRCVKPSHLYAGDALTNAQDRSRRGRPTYTWVAPEAQCHGFVRNGKKCRHGGTYASGGGRYCARHVPTPFDAELAEADKLAEEARRKASALRAKAARHRAATLDGLSRVKRRGAGVH
jgi:hypothetical protein